MRAIALMLVALASLPSTVCADQDGESRQVGVALLLQLQDEPITPISARFLKRTLDRAGEEHATCVIIQLDTPGGLLDATRTMVKDILSSPVPVVVYVAPSGARAASAGVFITLAGHVAAMAPGTHIGAAHPVTIGGLPTGPPSQPDEPSKEKESGRPSAIEEKLVSDTRAAARALAELRGRNADWAARAVAESSSITSTEALKEGVIDLIADDVGELLVQIDGREVTVRDAVVKLHTRDANVRAVEMWWGEQLLAVICNPNIAFLLLVLGFYGILFEFYSPGWGVAGTLGALCLLLGFFGLSFLPINYVGLALIGAGLALFVAEAFVTSFGALTVGGIVCLMLGGLMLVDSPIGFLRVSLVVVVPVAAATAGIAFFLIGSIVKAHRAPPVTGSEGLLGRVAVADEDFRELAEKWSGTVRVHGEIWNAISTEPVQTGQPVRVVGRNGLTLGVERDQAAPSERGRASSAST